MRFELTNREMQAKEIMTEAEVRHAVGEYDEARWQAIRGETTRVLVTVREELTKTNTEIDRLVEVQALIVQPSPPAPPPAPAAPPPAPPAPAVAAVPPAPTVPPPPRVSGPRPMPEIPFLQLEPDFNTAASPAASASVAGPVPPEPEAPSKLPLTGKPPAGAPKTAPKPKEEQPARTLWYPSGKGAETGGGAAGKLDELAFLKSVSNEPAPPRRASGGFKTSDAVTPPPPPHTPSVPLLTTADPFASKSQPVVDPKRGSASVPKTLKCGECGTLNRPTEWYCERCRAELAAL